MSRFGREKKKMSSKEVSNQINAALGVAIVALLIAITGVVMAAVSFTGKAPAGSVTENELSDSLKAKLGI